LVLLELSREIFNVKNADIEGKFEGTIRVAEILNVKAQVIKGEVTKGNYP
jgi:hypothetical protein